jgi:endonuclease YncB( thermonuclease family)
VKSFQQQRIRNPKIQMSAITDDPANRKRFDVVQAASRAAEIVPGPVQATVLRVIDGDTFEARALIWPDIEVTVAVRLAGIDAPELHAPCPRERELGTAAHALLAGELPAAGSVLLSQVAHDKYAGRIVAEVRLPDGRSAAPLLLASGLATPFGQAHDWCSR